MTASTFGTLTPSAFVSSTPLTSSTPVNIFCTAQTARARTTRTISQRRLLLCQTSLPEDPNNRQQKRFNRRQAIQLFNAALGFTTLSLIVKMREQFRLISPRAVLATLGISTTPFRTAVPPALAAATVRSDGFKEALEYVRTVDSRPPVAVPDFPRGSDWINSAPLSLRSQLAGKLVLVDFFTYCCINCQHVLPKLRKLELKYGEDGSSGLVVVGVHSAKFSAERETANIAAAVERYDVKHPVINDERMQLWNAVGVSSWPTLGLIGPRGNLIAVWSGERQEEDIDNVVAAALEFYSDEIDHRPLPPAPKTRAAFGQLAKSPLRYPGKVAVSADGSRLFVADSGNNRVLELDEVSGRVLRVFGNGEPGLVDADIAKNAQFHSPQGLATRGDTLYVADLESHAVRAIDLVSGSVSTLGGNGEQGFDFSGGKSGNQQLLSSPWDVEVVGDDLFVAMAGTHQLWKLPLAKPRAAWEVFSGSGRELEKNSSVGRTAAWAQPSHLSASTSGLMYVADSESSTLRVIDLTADAHPTRTLAGGDGMLAQNLFAFGDAEGKGAKAKFQHPLAVCSDDRRNVVYIADSYNHRIKTVDETGRAKFFCGVGVPGFKDGTTKDAMFWEPAGLALSPDGMKLYVSDTNNFAIRVLDTRSGRVTTLKVVMDGAQTSATPAAKRLISNRRRAVQIAAEAVKKDSKLSVKVTLPEKAHFTPGTSSRYQINVIGDSSSRDDLQAVLFSGTITQAEGSGSFSVAFSDKTDVFTAGTSLEIETMTYYCTEVDDVCRMEPAIISVPIDASAQKEVTISHTISPRKVASASTA